MIGTDMIGRMRSLVAFLAGALACLLLPLAVASAWVDTVVNDVDEYVDTVAPLAEDERVQNAVADRMADIALGQLGVGVARSMVRDAALQVLETELFARAWRTANRAAHPQLLALLRDGEGVGDDGEVTLDLAPLLAAMLDQVPAGAAIGGLAPGTDLTFTVARSEDLREARAAYAVVDPAGFWLPGLWVALVALALLVARRRRGAATWLAVGSAGSLAAFWLQLGIARAVFADSLPGADAELGGAVFDVVTDSLVTLAVSLIVVSVVAVAAVALAGMLFGRRKEPSWQST